MNKTGKMLASIRELQAKGDHTSASSQCDWREYVDESAILLAFSDSFRFLKKWDELRLVANAIIEKCPENLLQWGYYALAESEYQLGNLDDALVAVEQNIRLKDDHYWAHLLKAKIHLDKREYRDCGNECDIARTLDPNCQSTYDIYLKLLENSTDGTTDLETIKYDMLSATEIDRLSAVFDERFYARTNPECNVENGLKHYIDEGWLEGRDPAGNFNTAEYLKSYEANKPISICPLVHYEYFGKSNEYTLSSSDHQIISVCVMVKNEGDIIEAFSSHVLALFDNIVFIDHCSSDGTSEFLLQLAEKLEKVKVYQLKEPSYIQAIAMNHVVRSDASIQGSDWLFMLDCDEFLPFANREELGGYLGKNKNHKAVFFGWKNLVPVQYWDQQVSFDSSLKALVPSEFSVHGKVAFQLGLYSEFPELWISQGNHAVLNYKDGVPFPVLETNLPIYHLPIRSVNQFSLKLSQGVRSYKAIGEKRNKLEGLHWFQIVEQLKGREITDELLNRVVMDYGNHQCWDPIDHAELSNNGFEIGEIPFAQMELPVHFDRRSRFIEMMLRESSTEESSSKYPVKSIVTMNGDSLVAESHQAQILVDTQPEKRGDDSEYATMDDLEFMSEFLKPSYWDIDNLTPTAWGGHIPFLFCLVSLTRPRSYAELGTHYGASFFAFCQACVRREIESKPVAIDCWEGDDHTGAYEESVFNQFRHLVHKYDSFANYLRMYFDDASEYFSPGSVDLLHIDGLHTYEAVKHDYETWLDRMSDVGVILFHDINVHERDFGVWQFWIELKEIYPTIEFKHSHGLGVAYVGSARNKNIERLLDLCSDEKMMSFLQHHFESISQAKNQIALNKYKIHELQAIADQYPKLTADNVLLQQQLNAVSCEKDNLSDIIKFKMKNLDIMDAA